ncbi:hypothetical protein [Mesorhizobium sp.]|uniref:hypothetical protein n=1 Tax=Mesorhizobium sp. TaxID=1871066 RepID=UPI00257B13A9|nr:hypothetical protein [Mesorhizobium sp.]
MVVLLPRLAGPVAEAIVRRFLDQGPENWAEFNARDLPEGIRFAATGGTRITDHQLQALREKLKALATKCGFGVGSSGREAFARFDAEAAAWIAQDEVFGSGEAMRDDMWNFIGAVLAPDIVHWRFGTALERYLGGVRNTFQRLWMRGRALDRGVDHPRRWQLLDELTEDALVQITERPSIGGDPVLALAIGEAWLRAAMHFGKPAMESVMRRAVLRIRIRNEIRAYVELPPADLTTLLDQAYGTPISESEATKIPAAVSNSSQAARKPSDIGSEQVRIREIETGEIAISLERALGRINIEAELRGWLSPKSRAALADLKRGSSELQARERKALEYLLKRLSDSSVLSAEINQVRTAISSRLSTVDMADDPRPRSSRWAIWRAR